MPRSSAQRVPAVLPLLALFACATELDQPVKSSLPIVNGDLTSAYPSAGALLFGADPAVSTIQCSGTLIGCDTFLTAAHCVCPTDGADCQGGTPVEPMR